MTPVRDASGVWRVFDGIAWRYDAANTLLSMGSDRIWRRRLAGCICGSAPASVLDIATGTGEVLMALARHPRRPACLAGVDMSAEMLHVARRKAYGVPCLLARGDALRLPFPGETFDAAAIAFGIRNVADPGAALGEFARVLRKDGRMAVLEFSLPENAWLRSAYLLYFRHVLPRIGGWLAGDRAAYHYLNASVETFPFGAAFCKIMSDAGFGDVQARPMSGGIATLYTGLRR